MANRIDFATIACATTFKAESLLFAKVIASIFCAICYIALKQQSHWLQCKDSVRLRVIFTK